MKTKLNFCIYLLTVGVFIQFLSSCKRDEENNDDNNNKNSVTDTRDGNIYKTVTIGSQVWFAENLRYTGNILQVSENAEWEAIFYNETGQPAWCYYDNSPANDEIYGKLYNWYAVNTGTLCPPGWHIPTDAEWTQLTDYLGGANVAGGKMKTTTGWDPPNTGATNESGFSGLPGGMRWSNGEFIFGARHGVWWSSTDDGPSSAMSRHLSFGESAARTFWEGKTHGGSCRCMKD